MHGIDLLHIRIFFLYSQLISKIVIFWCNVDDFTVFLLLQNSSDFEICSVMLDNDIMLNNNFFLYISQVVWVEYRHKHIVKFY